ncbi:hypothetical protein CSA37_07595 [Candidatus Fermentibacteria bacterium]|nr:MAG: hypothetical protein CSA37_07595 [Candidatus Fermentibacteria bacterium]
MKFWFDADNSPHVLVMEPLAAELKARGHTVVFTARRRAATCALMDLYGLDYSLVGEGQQSGFIHKAAGTLRRAAALARHMRRSGGADLSFGHGSRALPVASFLLGIPSVTMYDYEWVNPAIFNLFCKSILLPEAVGREACKSAGLKLSKVVPFPGFKEQLYLDSVDTSREIAEDLGLRESSVRILLRPPAVTAHYHNPEAEDIMETVLECISRADSVQLIMFPRGSERLPESFAQGPVEVIIPEKMYNGPSLVRACDMVIGGGGTITREAALLGVPSYSFFRGREGSVDAFLEKSGSLVILRNSEDVEEKLKTVKRKTVLPEPPCSRQLVRCIADCLETAAQP